MGRASDVVSLVPVADTGLLENLPTNNMGGQMWFNAGTTQNYRRNRGLLKFDVTTALPPRARLLGVTVTLQVTHSPVDGDTPSTFDLHRMLRDWGEGDKSGNPPLLGALATVGESTWLDRFALTGQAWAEPGGASGIDFADESSADTYVYSENFSPYTFDSTPNLVSDVQLWLQHPDQNFGWLLQTRVETNNFSARRFASREDPFGPPVLALEYDLPRLDSIQFTNGMVSLAFHLEAGETCAVEHTESLDASEWTVLSEIAAGATATNVVVFDANTPDQRYYRLHFR
jgi:hypothetical protein